MRLSTGYECPAMAVGTFQMLEAEKIVYEAIKIGYRHIDTAAIYRNEDQVGRAIKLAVQEGICSRSELFITTKISPKDQGYQKASHAVQVSLENLGLEYIDLMLVHWPGSAKLNASNIKNKQNRIETVKALSESKQIRSIGVSNFNISHFDGIEQKIHVNQFEFHPLIWTDETRELLDYCTRNEIVVGGYSCLGQGELLDAKKFPELDTIAKKHNATMGQVLIQWALSKGCIVMPKASSVHRLKENYDAQFMKLDQIDIELIQGIVKRVGRVKYCWDPEQII
jgi:methylglyoxal/glyoxal reductase